MGKGDRKTAKGKRFNASYGNARPQAAATALCGAFAFPGVAGPRSQATRTPPA